jgi:hypothetical protein
MEVIQLLQRLTIPGGASYMPGERIGVSEEEALIYVEKGFAELISTSTPAAEPAASPVVDGPPKDKMLRREGAVRK